MKRWLFNISAALSLLLLVATVALWVRSYWVSDVLLWRAQGWASVWLGANRGSIDFMRAQSTPDYFEIFHAPAAQTTCPHWAYAARWCVLGFACYDNPDIHQVAVYGHIRRPPIPCTEFVAPLWPFVLALAMLPLLRGYRGRIWRRRSIPDMCPNCGYDLRASSDRCPECGTPIPAGVVKEVIT